jgi:spore coat polysaccharide biosynthesis protein SpsF
VIRGSSPRNSAARCSFDSRTTNRIRTVATGTTWALVAARMGSTRLPGKALVDLAGKLALERVIERLQRVPSLDGICVATTMLKEDDAICATATSAGASFYRGASDDLLSRLLSAATDYGIDTIVYITADCPLVDPLIIDRVIAQFQATSCDYASNRLYGYSFPIGMDVEVFSTEALARANTSTTDPRDREHVTTVFYDFPQATCFATTSVIAPQRLRRPEIRLTLDTEEDLAFIRAIYNGMRGVPYGLGDILDFLDANPHLLKLNAHVEQVVP